MQRSSSLQSLLIQLKKGKDNTKLRNCKDIHSQAIQMKDKKQDSQKQLRSAQQRRTIQNQCNKRTENLQNKQDYQSKENDELISPWEQKEIMKDDFHNCDYDQEVYFLYNQPINSEQEMREETKQEKKKFILPCHSARVNANFPNSSTTTTTPRIKSENDQEKKQFFTFQKDSSYQLGLNSEIQYPSSRQSVRENAQDTSPSQNSKIYPEYLRNRDAQSISLFNKVDLVDELLPPKQYQNTQSIQEMYQTSNSHDIIRVENAQIEGKSSSYQAIEYSTRLKNKLYDKIPQSKPLLNCQNVCISQQSPQIFQKYPNLKLSQQSPYLSLRTQSPNQTIQQQSANKSPLMNNLSTPRFIHIQDTYLGNDQSKAKVQCKKNMNINLMQFAQVTQTQQLIIHQNDNDNKIQLDQKSMKPIDFLHQLNKNNTPWQRLFPSCFSCHTQENSRSGTSTSDQSLTERLYLKQSKLHQKATNFSTIKHLHSNILESYRNLTNSKKKKMYGLLEVSTQKNLKLQQIANNNTNNSLKYTNNNSNSIKQTNQNQLRQLQSQDQIPNQQANQLISDVFSTLPSQLSIQGQMKIYQNQYNQNNKQICNSEQKLTTEGSTLYNRQSENGEDILVFKNLFPDQTQNYSQQSTSSSPQKKSSRLLSDYASEVQQNCQIKGNIQKININFLHQRNHFCQSKVFSQRDDQSTLVLSDYTIPIRSPINNQSSKLSERQSKNGSIYGLLDFKSYKSITKSLPLYKCKTQSRNGDYKNVSKKGYPHFQIEDLIAIKQQQQILKRIQTSMQSKPINLQIQS